MFLNIFIYVLEKSKVFKGTQNPTSESSDNRTCASWHNRAPRVSLKPHKRESRQMQTCLQFDMTERKGFLPKPRKSKRKTFDS